MRLIKLSSKGQVVLPKEIRTAVKAEPGTTFRVFLEEKKIILEPVSKSLVDHLYGKFSGTPLLDDLEDEHAKEIGKEKGA